MSNRFDFLCEESDSDNDSKSDSSSDIYSKSETVSDVEEDGVITHYYDDSNQIVCKYTLKNGRRTGLYEEYYEDGSPSVKCYYENGILNGFAQLWYSPKYAKNGSNQIEFQCNFVNGIKDGLYESWYKNGEKEYKYTLVNGLREAKYEEYKKDGTKIKCYYKYGLLDGKYKVYDNEENVIEYKKFKDGILIKEK
jgi:antitoxin component YwqK of YwqJK toxin-antitoxin module